MLSKIEKAVLKAGEHFLKGFNGSKDVHHKGRIDLVTQYDVEIERMLMEELSFMAPEYGFVGEETHNTDSGVKKNIYIDPIDGTTNFVHGFPFCCISVGVYDGSDGEYGVVYNPVMNELFKAERDQGAYLNGQKINVSKKTALSECLIATGFPYSSAVTGTGNLLPILDRVLNNTRGIRRAGSAALDLCYVAKGVFDAYYEFNLGPWDLAAGAVIAKEAGADVFGHDTDRYELYEKFIAAAAPGIKKELISLLKI